MYSGPEKKVLKLLTQCQVPPPRNVYWLPVDEMPLQELAKAVKGYLDLVGQNEEVT